MSTLDRLTSSERSQLRDEALPDWLDPMLATLTDDHFSDPDWVYERKLDGERALAYVGGSGLRLLSRNGTLLNDTYPEVEDALAEIDVDAVVLDGVSTRQLPLRTRKSLLRGAIDVTDPVRWVNHRNTEGVAWLDEACAKGWEGLIAKRADAPYHHGRSRDWLKFKCVAQQELVIGGYTEPHGQRERFGALLVGYHDGDGQLRYAGKVGTGYDHDTLERVGELLEQRERDTFPFADDVAADGVHWVTPDLVAQIGFTEWTHDGRLRHPRFLGLRDDKDAGEVVRERADPRAS